MKATWPWGQVAFCWWAAGGALMRTQQGGALCALAVEEGRKAGRRGHLRVLVSLGCIVMDAPWMLLS